ncbi:MAG: hypothetical protein H0Z29_03765 [Candidatus Marinimicrobia bacterium]|nr:hypothetical protein [Candidatus Neomarinimicrobiota bacterium]
MMKEKYPLFTIVDNPDIKKILLCLPVDELFFMKAFEKFKDLKLKNSEIYFLIHQSFFHLIRGVDRHYLIPLIDYYLNRKGIPNKNFYKEIIKDKFFCSVDLNLKFNITTANIVKNSAYNQRIGKKFDHSSKYFNIEIVSNNSTKFYDKVIEILNNIK